MNETITVGLYPALDALVGCDDVVGVVCENEGDCLGATDFIEVREGDGPGQVSLEKFEFDGYKRTVAVLNS